MLRGVRWWVWAACAVGAAASADLAGCSGVSSTPDDGGFDATAPQGTEGGPCFPNGTCYAGLTCTLVGGTGVCAPVDATASDVTSDMTSADGPDDAVSGDAQGGDAGDAQAGDAGDAQAADAGDAQAGDGGCKNLQCQQTCSSTSISGKVYDPAAANGLYNVYVYVPNDTLAAIPDGPSCTPCQAPASGSPIAWTTTASDGTFTLTNAPSGANIPLVLQIGKWRRHLTLSNVTTCVDNPQPDKSLRLPKKQHETSSDDNIPLMALTTGCEGTECFLLERIGIDPSEFTSSNGTGRVRIYKSTNDDGQTFPAPYNGSGAQNASYLWNTSTEIMKYDTVIDACECSTYSRGTSGYANMLNYLDAGGRALTTHYFYNFFANVTQCGGDTTCQGQSPLPTVGAWGGNQGLPYAADNPNCPNDPNMTQSGVCLGIDTKFPRGKAFADWYKANNTTLTNGGGEAYGYCGLTDVRHDMGQLSASLLSAGTATPWLFAGDVTNNYDAYYLSFNTPVGTNPSTQCGRAVFSDVHFGGAPNQSFPSYCGTNVNADDHAPNELALEFLFFDLSSCVQNETQQPLTPPQQ